MTNMNRNNELRFEIVEQVAVLAEQPTGWTKELNLVSWNDNPPKYDIREWNPEHDRMSKGVRLSPEEMQRLKEAVMDREFMPREFEQER